MNLLPDTVAKTNLAANWRGYTHVTDPLGRKIHYDWWRHKAFRLVRTEREGKQDRISVLCNRHRLAADPTSGNSLVSYDHVRERVLTNPGIGIMYASHAEIVGPGPKVFLPTATDCTSMQHVALNVPLSEYRQPFRGVVIEIPEEFRQDHPCPLFPELGIEYPAVVGVVHFDEIGWVTLQIVFSRGNYYSCEVDLRQPPGEPITLENTLTRRLDFDATMIPARTIIALWRIAFNSCLLMTHYRVAARLADPERVEWLKDRIRKAKKVRPEVREGNRIEVATAPSILSFEQHVKIYDEEPAPPDEGFCADGESGRASPRPHWRAGHWAMQAHGEGGTLRKRIFRKSSLVNGHRFSGRLCDTRVVATT